MKKFFLKIFYNLAVIYWNIFKPTTVGVRVVVEHEGKVLLVKPSYSLWYYFPGGGVDHNKESLEEAALRELKEETNLIGKNLQLFDVHRNFIHNKRDTVITYKAEIDNSDEIKIDQVEIIDYGWFYPEALPSNTHELTKRALKILYNQVK